MRFCKVFIWLWINFVKVVLFLFNWWYCFLFLNFLLFGVKVKIFCFFLKSVLKFLFFFVKVWLMDWYFVSFCLVYVMFVFCVMESIFIVCIFVVRLVENVNNLVYILVKLFSFLSWFILLISCCFIVWIFVVSFCIFCLIVDWLELFCLIEKVVICVDSEESICL